MGKSSAPKPPDPQAQAQAQTQSNLFSAQANNLMGMMGVRTPDGRIDYTQTGTQTITGPGGERYTIPQYEMRTSLAGPLRQANTANNQTQRVLAETGLDQSRNLRGMLESGVDFSGQPALRSDFAGGGRIQTSYAGADDFSKDRRRVEDALMQRMSRQIDGDREQLRTQLANQGISVGSDAYSDSFADFQQGVNDARLGAILAGGQEQSRLVGLARDAAAFNNDATQMQFNRNLTRANFQNAARSQGVNETLQQRNQGINEIAALLGGSQVQMPQGPGFRPVSMPTTDVAGLEQANYGQRLNNWQTQQAQRQGLLGGLFDMGSSLGAARIMAG